MPVAAPSTAPFGAEHTSEAETTAGGFIAGVLGVLIVTASVLYWRKRDVRDEAPEGEA